MASVAVIGCGTISNVHFASLTSMEEVELVAVCDTDSQRLKRAAARYDVPGYLNHRELLSDVQPDVLHICTPHNQHVEIAIDALAMGVDVLLEKPVAHTYSEAVRLVDIAEASRASLGVCLQNRYNATAQAAHNLLAGDALGKVLGAWATVFWSRDTSYYEAAPWRADINQSGGGLLINQAIHTIDLLQWLMGEVVRVQGHVSKFAALPGQVEDTALAVLHHGSNGPKTIFTGSLQHSNNTPILVEIETENATLRIEGDLTVRWRDGRIEKVKERDTSRAFRSYWGVSHELLIEDFYQSRARGEKFWIDGSEAAKSLRIVTDLYGESQHLPFPR